MSRFTASFLFLSLFCSSPAYSEPLVLDGAPISDLVAWVSEVSQRSIVIPADLKIDVWLRVPDADAKNALSILRSVVSSNGWRMVDNGNGSIISFVLNPPGQVNNPVQEVNEQKNSITKVFPLLNRQTSEVIQSLNALNLHCRYSQGPNNLLIASGNADAIDKVQSLISSLDVAKARYQISAIITEDYLNDSEKQGTNLIQDGTDLKVSSLFAPFNMSGVIAKLVAAGDFSALYTFLMSRASFHILSTPYVILDDGNTGSLHVGDNVPVLTGQTVANGQTVTTYTRQDVGLILNITVRNIGQRLSLDVVQEASSVSPSSTENQLVTSQRKISTKSSVLPGEIVDFGGLTTEENRTTINGIPGLRSLPVIGFLFRGSSTEKIKKNLHVFLRVSLI